jgi:hypothetical protein
MPGEKLGELTGFDQAGVWILTKEAFSEGTKPLELGVIAP